MNAQTNTASPFLYRHIGPSIADQREMLKALEVTSVEALITQTVPDEIRFKSTLQMEEGVSEEQALAELATKLGKNTVAKSLIGQGYHGVHVPPVI